MNGRHTTSPNDERALMMSDNKIIKSQIEIFKKDCTRVQLSEASAQSFISQGFYKKFSLSKTVKIFSLMLQNQENIHTWSQN